MDGLAVFGLVMLGILVVALGLLGWFFAETGNGSSSVEKARSARAEHFENIDDLGQMLEATNERRRRLGLDALDADSAPKELVPEEPEPAPGEAAPAPVNDFELLEMRNALEIHNKQRRAQGKPDLTEEQFREKLAQSRR